VGPDASDTLMFHVDESFSYDNNLFRLPSGVAPATGDGNTDRGSLIRTDKAGVSWDKQYSLQHIHADARVEHHQYSNHGFLNFDSVNGSFAWNWSFTPHLTGVLSVDRTQSLNSFTDFRNQSARNLRTNLSKVASFDYEALGSWHLIGAVINYSSLSDNNTLPVEDAYRSRGVQGGVKYVLSSGSYVSYVERSDNGEYPAQGVAPGSLVDTSFHQRAHELQAMWAYSEKTSLTGRITNSDRRHQNLGQRDYSGTGGRVDMSWKPTGKIILVAAAGRELTAYQTSYSNYIVTDSISFAPTWKITEKTQLKGKVSHSVRDYMGQPTGPVSMRKDTVDSTQLELDWEAARNIDVATILQHDKRGSSYSGFGFGDTTATLNLRLGF